MVPSDYDDDDDADQRGGEQFGARNDPPSPPHPHPVFRPSWFQRLWERIFGYDTGAGD